MIYLELLWTFFRIGAFTFGGGYAMLPLIQAEVVSHGWMKVDELVNFIAVSESTPGPFAVNISTYVGAEVAGLFGAFCATFGVVLPSFMIILLVAKCFDKFSQNMVVSGCMSGLKPAVAGLIGASAVSVGQTVFFPDGIVSAVLTEPAFFVSAAVFVIMLVLSEKKVHPVAVIVMSAVVGIAAGYLIF